LLGLSWSGADSLGAGRYGLCCASDGVKVWFSSLFFVCVADHFDLFFALVDGFRWLVLVLLFF
jgi:hypothetical protein